MPDAGAFAGPGQAAEDDFAEVAAPEQSGGGRFGPGGAGREVAQHHVGAEGSSARLFRIGRASVGCEPAGALGEARAAQQHDDGKDRDEDRQPVPHRGAPVAEQEDAEARHEDAAQGREGFGDAYHRQPPAPGHDLGDVVRIEGVAAPPMPAPMRKSPTIRVRRRSCVRVTASEAKRMSAGQKRKRNR